MSQYAAEAAPATIDPVLAEFLMRQFLAIQNALTNSSIVMEVGKVPEPPIPGAIINVRDTDNEADNGIYACVYNSQGEAEWSKLQTTP